MHVLQTVPVYADANRQRIPAVYLAAFEEQTAQRVLHALLLREYGEMIRADMTAVLLREGAHEKPRERAQELIPLGKALLRVEVFHAV